jgi:hypothetical protein
MRASIATAVLLAATVSAHGNITSPLARLPGPGMVKACGQSAVNNVLADGTIPLEDVFNVLPSCKWHPTRNKCHILIGLKANSTSAAAPSSRTTKHEYRISVPAK